MSYREELRDDAYVIADFIIGLPDGLRAQVSEEVSARVTSAGHPGDRTLYRMVRFAVHALDPGVLHEDDFFDLFDWEQEQ
jgi:hypothetical protein